MRRGCFICGVQMDRIFILSTPKDKFKLCRRCFEIAKRIAVNAEDKVKEDN